MPTGLDLVRMMIAGDMPPPSMGQHMNMALVEADVGYAKFTAKADDTHFNPMGAVHGGFAATVLDSACGMATISTCEEGMAFTTIDLAIKMMRPVPVGVTCTCEGRVQKAGRRVTFVEAWLKDPDGKLIAHATSSCAIIPIPGAQ